MALESGNYVNDLNILWPLTSDPKSQGDDHLRLVKSILKSTLNGFTGSILLTATDTGTATGHILTPSTALVGYTPMLCLLYQPLVTNTGAVTVNVSGLGVKSIKTMAGADPTAGDLVAGYPVLLVYNGSNFVTLAGSEFLSKTGAQTLTGNLTLLGNMIQTGNQTLTGNKTVSGTLAVTGATSLQSATGVTMTVGNATTNLATTAFTADAVAAEAAIRLSADNAEITARSNAVTTLTNTFANYAPLASPALTGTPSAPTAAAGTGTAQIATTAFVAAAAFSAVLPGQAGNAGKFVTTDGIVASWGFAGDVTLTGTQTLTNKTLTGYTETVQALATSGSIALSVAAGTIKTCAASAAVTFTDSIVAGQSVVVMLTNGSTYTITFPTMTWVGPTGNVAPTLNAANVLVFWKVNSTLYGAHVGKYA